MCPRPRPRRDPAKGLRPTVTLLPDGPESDLVARIDVVPDHVELTELAQAIPNRHTNRGPYRPEPVDQALLDELRAPGGDGASVRWVMEDGPRQSLSELMVDAAQAVADDDAMSRDGHTWFRPSGSAAEAHRDGLTVDGQGLSAPAGGGEVAAVAGVPVDGRRHLGQADPTVHTRTAAAYGVVLVDDPYDRAGQLAGGRLAQRVHLAATTAGLALPHMNQVTERIDRDRRAGQPNDYPARLARILGDGDATRVLNIFRVGWPVRPGQASPRRAAHQVVDTQS